MTVSRDERRAAAAAHLSAAAVAAAVAATLGGPLLIAVMAAPAGPLAVALLTRRAGLFVRGHVREALRFCLSFGFYATGVALGLAAGATYDAFAEAYPLLLFIQIFLVLTWLSFIVIAVSRALHGREWRYPFTIGRRRRATSS